MLLPFPPPQEAEQGGRVRVQAAGEELPAARQGDPEAEELLQLGHGRGGGVRPAQLNRQVNEVRRRRKKKRCISFPDGYFDFWRKNK